jgi:hypothetical protein
MLALPPAIVVLLRRAVPVHVDQRFIRKHIILRSFPGCPYYPLQLCMYIPVFLPPQA